VGAGAGCAATAGTPHFFSGVASAHSPVCTSWLKPYEHFSQVADTGFGRLPADGHVAPAVSDVRKRPAARRQLLRSRPV
jgi:hypothetical protein